MGRRRGKTTRDAFAEEQEGHSHDEVLGALLPELRGLDRQAMRIKALPLADIRPDPVQPRRDMPEDLRLEWVRHPDQIWAVLDEWLKRANEFARGRGRPEIDPRAILTNQENTSQEDLPDPDPVEGSFLKLLYDAATIYDHGLEHPITVTRWDDVWLLESGERRTLMHWALARWVDAEKWTHIPSVEVEQRSVWRQAAENNARQDLNAIERARQLALLLMDCYPDQQFVPFDQLSSQEFYQQAVDLRVPYGKGGEFLAVMGLRDNAQIRRFRRLLTLPYEVWMLADELDWTEGRLRALIQKARQPPQGMSEEEYVIHLARIEAGMVDGPPDVQPEVDIQEGESVPIGTNLEEQDVSSADKIVLRLKRTYSAMVRVTQMSDDDIRKIAPEDRAEMVRLAREIIRRFE
jgi:hypothetical protein